MKNNSADWGEIFDLIAGEYGYTSNEFGSLTMRQLDILCKNLAIRKNNEYAIIARMHGINARIKHRENEKMLEVDELIENKGLQMMNETLKEKQRKIKEKWQTSK